MRFMLGLGLLLSALSFGGCDGTPECDPPVGCVRSDSVQGTCQCQEWQVTRIEAVPVKYLVLTVEYAAPGNASVLVYGHNGASLPPAASELGSRFRAVVRPASGPDQVASLGHIDQGIGGGLVPVTATSVAYLLAGQGSAWSYLNSVDVETTAMDRIVVWVNPTLTVTTNYLGERRADWAWTPVAGCYRPTSLPCNGPMVLGILAGELDGTISPVKDHYTAQFMASLTEAERLDLLSYDAFYDPPGRDPATFGTDPRLLLLGSAAASPGASSYPATSWTPCNGTLTDANFGVLHESTVRFASTGDKLALQHGVLSSTPACSPQAPGLLLATTTPGCQFTATVYLDRMFGTVLTVPNTTSAACTVFVP